MSVREIEELVNRIKNQGTKQAVILDSNVKRKIIEWQSYLSRQLSSEVKVNIGSNGRGKVVIHFDSMEEAEYLIRNIAGDDTRIIK